MGWSTLSLVPSSSLVTTTGTHPRAGAMITPTWLGDRIFGIFPAPDGAWLCLSTTHVPEHPQLPLLSISGKLEPPIITTTPSSIVTVVNTIVEALLKRKGWRRDKVADTTSRHQDIA